MAKIAHKDRLIFAIIYFIVALGIFVIFKKQIFYLEPKESYNIFRLLWCLSCSFLGFSTLALLIAFSLPEILLIPSIPSYITLYPFMLIVVSCVGFSIFNALKVTNGYIFYYASFALCFTLGYFVDSLQSILLGISQTIKK